MYNFFISNPYKLLITLVGMVLRARGKSLTEHKVRKEHFILIPSCLKVALFPLCYDREAHSSCFYVHYKSIPKLNIYLGL